MPNQIAKTQCEEARLRRYRLPPPATCMYDTTDLLARESYLADLMVFPAYPLPVPSHHIQNTLFLQYQRRSGCRHRTWCADPKQPALTGWSGSRISGT